MNLLFNTPKDTSATDQIIYFSSLSETPETPRCASSYKKKRTLSNVALYDFNALLELQTQPEENRDKRRESKIRSRLTLFLSPKRENSQYAEHVKNYLVPERIRLSPEEAWTQFVFYLSDCVKPEMSEGDICSIIEQIWVQIICPWYKDAIKESGTSKQTDAQIDDEIEVLAQCFRQQANDRAIIAQLAQKREEELITFQKNAEKAAINAQNEGFRIQMEFDEYQACLAATEEALSAHSAIKEARVRPRADEKLELGTEDQKQTILDKALKLADIELISSVLKYAKHAKSLDSLVRKTLEHIFDDSSLIVLEPDALLLLIHSNCFSDPAIVEKINTNAFNNRLSCSGSGDAPEPQPLFPTLFTKSHKLNEDLIKNLLENKNTDDKLIAELIDAANDDFHKLLINEIKRRYSLEKEDDANIEFSPFILNALKKRAAQTKQYENLTHDFAKALDNACKEFRLDPGLYKQKLDEILAPLETDSSKTNEDPHELAKTIATELSNNKGSVLYKYRDTSSFHIRTAKTMRIINNIANPGYGRLFSSCYASKPKSPNLTKISKLEINKLIEKGCYTAESRKRALLVEKAFMQTLRYLRTVSIYNGYKVNSKYAVMEQLVSDFVLKGTPVKDFIEKLSPPDDLNPQTVSVNENTPESIYTQLSKPMLKWGNSIWGKATNSKTKQYLASEVDAAKGLLSTVLTNKAL